MKTSLKRFKRPIYRELIHTLLQLLALLLGIMVPICDGLCFTFFLLSVCFLSMRRAYNLNGVRYCVNTYSTKFDIKIVQCPLINTNYELA